MFAPLNIDIEAFISKDRHRRDTALSQFGNRQANGKDRAVLFILLASQGQLPMMQCDDAFHK
jgi:hypothetical protein